MENAIVERHLNIPAAMAVKLGIPHWLRDEAESEGLVALAEAYQTYDEDKNESLEAYLCWIVRKRLLTWCKREIRSQRPVGIIPTPMHPDTTEWFSFRELVNRLPPPDRAVLCGVGLGYEPEEMAPVTGRDRVGMWRRFRRLKQKIAKGEESWH